MYALHICDAASFVLCCFPWQADFVLYDAPTIGWEAEKKLTNPLWWSRILPMPVRL